MITVYVLLLVFGAFASFMVGKTKGQNFPIFLTALVVLFIQAIISCFVAWPFIAFFEFGTILFILAVVTAFLSNAVFVFVGIKIRM